MSSTKQKALAAAGIIGGIGAYFGTAITGIVLMGNENSIDNKAHTDVVQIVDKVDRTLLGEGPTSFNKDITELSTNYELHSPATSLQMTGTFKDGYCIRVTNPGGRETEKGKTYSISSEGELNAGSSRCNTLLQNSSVIAGPAINEGSKTEWEAVDTNKWVFGGINAVLILGALGGIIVSSGSNKATSKKPAQLAPTSAPNEGNKSAQATTVHAGTAHLPETLPSLNARIAEVKKQWAEYELDLVKILEYPAVTNMSLPATSDFHKAMRQVKVLMPEGIPASITSMSVLSEAVLDLEHKFDVMISEAKRSKWSSFSDDERISLRTAQNLLSIAINAASTPNERQIAYKRLIREVEGILSFPEKGLLELEVLIAPEICDSIIETNMATA